jgi:transposase
MGRNAKHIKLEDKQKEELELSYKKDKQNTFRQRCHYILLNAGDYDIEEIGKIYKKSRQTIGKWLNRYEESGIEGLRTASGRGRHPIIRIDNEVEVKQVEDLVASSRQNLKVALVKIEEKLGKKMSKDTLKRLLKKKDGFGNDLEK